MRRTAFTLAASLLALPPRAAELPGQGREQVTIDYAVTSLAPAGPQHKGDQVVFRFEFSGVSHGEAESSMFDRLRVRCSGVSELAGERADCVASDSDGDELSFGYQSPTPEGGAASSRATFVGGTGKFAGLSGIAEGANSGLGASAGLPRWRTRLDMRWRRTDARAAAEAR